MKEVGAFISPGVAGWRINLLFPYFTEGFTRQALWAMMGIAVCVVMLLATTVQRMAQRLRSAGGRGVAAAALAAIAIATTASGTWAHWHPRFRPRTTTSRAGSRWSRPTSMPATARCAGRHDAVRSARKTSPRTLWSRWRSRRRQPAGDRTRFHVAATGPDGPVFGTVRFDFGDGQVELAADDRRDLRPHP